MAFVLFQKFICTPSHLNFMIIFFYRWRNSSLVKLNNLSVTTTADYLLPLKVRDGGLPRNQVDPWWSCHNSSILCSFLGMGMSFIHLERNLFMWMCFKISLFILGSFNIQPAAITGLPSFGWNLIIKPTRLLGGISGWKMHFSPEEYAILVRKLL